MASKAFFVVCIFTLAAELQLTSCQEGATSQRGNSSLPVAYSATVLEGGGQVCPPEEQLEMARAEIGRDVLRNIFCPGEVQENPASSCLEVSQCGPQLPSEYYWVTSANGSAVQVYCDMTRECKCSSASVGGWSRVAYLNTTDPTHQCPPAWRERTDTAVRTCGRTNETLSDNRTNGGGCSSVTFYSYGISYSHICGRIIGYLRGSPNGFDSQYTRIEDPYVEGVVITRGTEKQHVWSFGASVNPGSGNCPCSSSAIIPSFVGDNYFCEFRSPDHRFWDGENCEGDCCEFNDPPFFCTSFSEPTADNIEIAICANQDLINEDTPIELIEIFVQ